MTNKFTFLLFFYLLNFTCSQAKEKINLQLDWLHQFQFAGYYMAKEKNYYENNNLEVNIKEFDYNTNLLESVLNNNATYSVGKSSLIIDKLNGKNVVLLAAIYQNSPMVLLSLEKSKIKTIQDLANKKVMLTPDARSAASINAMIQSQKVKFNKIKFIPHSFKLDDLINGKTQAMGSYLSNEPYILKQKNIKFNIFNPKDYGFNFYGGLLFTSEKELKKNPQRVKKFYEASIKGWQYAFENIEETAQLIFDKYNSQNKSLESLVYEGEILKKLAQYNKGKLGDIDFSRIDEIKRLYLLLGLSTENKELVNETFIFNKNSILFNGTEKDFLQKHNISLITKNDNAPLSFKVSNYLEGIEIDFWKLLEKKLSINLNIIEEPKIPNILQKIDITNNILLQFTHDIKNIDLTKYSISHAFASLPLAIATRSNSKYIMNLKDVGKKNIALINNQFLYEKLRRKYTNINFVLVKNHKEAFKKLKEKKIFAIIDNIYSLSHKILKYNYTNFKIAGKLKDTLDLRLYTEKKNTVLINIINKSISEISKKEKVFILDKYKLVSYEKLSDNSWIYKYLLPLFILVSISLFFNRKMSNEIKKRKITEKNLKEFLNKDSLTKVLNRRRIEKILSEEIKRAKEINSTFSIIYFDVDDFKYINDVFGHLKGDNVLIELSKIVSLNIRKTDFLGRWGGEEFIVILPASSDGEAYNLAIKLKEIITNYDFGIKKELSSSFGISQYAIGDSKKDLVNRADEAMYFVKNSGKNAIKIF